MAHASSRELASGRIQPVRRRVICVVGSLQFGNWSKPRRFSNPSHRQDDICSANAKSAASFTLKNSRDGSPMVEISATGMRVSDGRSSSTVDIRNSPASSAALEYRKTREAYTSRRTAPAHRSLGHRRESLVSTSVADQSHERRGHEGHVPGDDHHVGSRASQRGVNPNQTPTLNAHIGNHPNLGQPRAARRSRC